MINIDSYDIKDNIHTGANFSVWRAIRHLDKKNVVLKVPTSLDNLHYIKTKLKHEYDIGSQLNSDNIIEYIGLEYNNDNYILILEDFNAVNLTNIIDNSGIRIDIFLDFAIQITNAIALIHAKKIIHRDINPSNILVNLDNNHVKLIDFDIASSVEFDSQNDVNLNNLVGTLKYISPEQTGRINRMIDYRSDFYSLGCTYYHMLCKQPPFNFDEPLELVHHHIAIKPTNPSQLNQDIPPVISSIIMKLMEKNADDRYQSAYGLVTDLEHCRDSLSQNNFIESFEIARYDISDKLIIPQKLYGRETELDLIMYIFESASLGRNETLFISGYSGVGKTALIGEIKKPVIDKRGYFITGKFTKFNKSTAYSGIIEAFESLINQLLGESEQRLQEWQELLNKSLYPNAKVITQLIPKIEILIGKQADIQNLGPVESQNRFNMVFCKFVSVFAQHPLVIFLDDLQWADDGSLNLLYQLSIHPDIKNFFLIVAYRDNEIDIYHPLMITLDKLKKEKNEIYEINIKPLKISCSKQIIADTLKLSINKIDELAKLIQQKTDGNPFFMKLFLQSIYDENLLKFSLGEGWYWKLKDIQLMQSSNNVIDLMTHKLKRFSIEIMEVLHLASCVGNSFSIEFLATIINCQVEEIYKKIEPVLNAGMLLPQKDGYFCFAHDKVREAIYEPMPEKYKINQHYKIGKFMLDKFSLIEISETIFAISDHLNIANHILTDAEKLELAKLNLSAGKKAKSNAAFNSALHYFSKGIMYLNTDTWQNNYALIYELSFELAEAEYLNGNFKQSQTIIKVLLQKSHNQTEKATIYSLLIYQYTVQAKYADGIRVGREALKLLNISLATKKMAKVLTREVQKTTALINKRTIQELIHSPPMVDPTKKAAMSILMNMQPTAYMSDPELYSLIAVKMVHISLRYGHTTESAKAYVTYANILTSVFSEFEQGHEFCQLGLKLGDMDNDLIQKCRNRFIYIAFLLHWTQPFVNGEKPFLESYNAGLEAGDLQYAGYTLGFGIANFYNQGLGLKEISYKIEKSLIFLNQTKHQMPLDVNQAFKQAILNLTGKTNNKLSFDTTIATEQQLIDKWQSQNILAVCYFHILKGQILFIYCEFKEALIAIRQAEQYLDYIRGTSSVAEFYFYYSLILIALFAKQNEKYKAAYLKIIETNQKKLSIYAKHCIENFQHKYLLVEAEVNRIYNKDLEAMELYDKAISAARNNNFIQDEAIANELAARFWLKRGKSEFAKAYLQKAKYGYQQWGAVAKVTDLEKKYLQITDILPQNTSFSMGEAGSTSLVTSSWLDLNSVLKASQTLSGEIVLSQLLEKIMHIVIENAGASSGFLLLPKQDSWFIEAKGHVDSDEVVIQSMDIETSEQVPKKIIHYVAHTQENVILHDATQEGNFTHISYIVKQRPKSVLCIPLLNQGQLIGILYLENNLTIGAFTSQRIETLNLLSSQIAISIKNARLYTNITQLNQAYKRFVPHEFLSLLEKQSIIEVELGDQVEKEMSILFADIRDFTSLSEKMSPQDNFDFINSYLSKMEPIISQYKGFIDKYIGDAIMALFPTNADDAVSAAISILKKLLDYNKDRQKAGYKLIDIGIGLNTGRLMLGTVGGENRMDCTVISDAVNLASRIEGMTKMYGVTLLISEDTYIHLNDASKYAIRTIDRVKVKGKSEPVTVYEIFDADPPILVKLKIQTLHDFENGLKNYREKVFTEAIICFNKVLSINPNDKVANIYLKRCQHWQNSEISDDWEGVETLDGK